MNIAADKYPGTSTVKILHVFFFFQSKTCHVFFMHYSQQFFSNVCINVTLQNSHRVCCVNNRQYALKKSATFTYRFLSTTFSYHLFVPPGIKVLKVRGCFNAVIIKGLRCTSFLLCQLNTKIQKSQPNAMSQNYPHNISM